jgi:hypothetical protein
MKAIFLGARRTSLSYKILLLEACEAHKNVDKHLFGDAGIESLAEQNVVWWVCALTY